LKRKKSEGGEGSEKGGPCPIACRQKISKNPPSTRFIRASEVVMLLEKGHKARKRRHFLAQKIHIVMII
jgi:hypothetical protein